MKLETRIRISISGFFLLTAVFTVAAVLMPDIAMRKSALVFALFFNTFAFVTQWLPVFTNLSVSLVLGPAFLGWIFEGFRAGLVFEKPFGFGLMAVICAYIVVAFVQGIFAGITLWFADEDF